MFRILVENCIAKHCGKFKCYLCNQKFLPDDFEEILKHVKHPKHKEQADLCAWNATDQQCKELRKLQLFSEDQYEELVINSITYKYAKFNCHLCFCRHLTEPFQHVHGKPHKRSYQGSMLNQTNANCAGKKENIEPNKVEQSLQSSQTASVNEQSTTVKSISQKELDFIQLEKNQIYFIKKSSSYICYACQSSIHKINACYLHIKESSHIENLKKFNQKYKMENLMISSVDKSKYFYCAKCNVYLSINYTLLQSHCLLHLHEELPHLNLDIIEFNIDKEKNVSIKCLLCQITVDTDKTLTEHLKTPKHLHKFNILTFIHRNKDFYKELEVKKENINFDLNLNDFDSKKDIYFTHFCKACYEPVGLDTKSDIQKIKQENKPSQELQNPDHKLKHLKIHLDSSAKYYKCFLCEKECSNIKIFFKHFNKSAHQRRLHIFHMILNNPDKNYLEKVFAALNNDCELSDKQKNDFPKTPKNVNSPEVQFRKERKVRQRSNEKFPYNKDILEFGNKYVLMCLESGSENIYSYDSEQIDQLQFGISLTFAQRPDRICIPCEYMIPFDLQYLYEHLQHQVHIQNLHDIKETDHEFQQYKDQFSDLDLAKSCMQEESDEWVKCFACNVSLPNFESDIKIHMNSTNHVMRIKSWKKDTESISQTFSSIFKDPWYYTDRFYCKLCKVAFNREISFAKHLDQPEHMQNVLQSKFTNKINICYACSSCWFGTSDYSKHYDEYTHIRFIKKNNDMLPKMKNTAIGFLNSAEKDVDALVKESDKVMLMNQDKEAKLLKSAEETVKSLYPNAKAYAFGSRASFLGFPNSDVDVFLDCENIYHNIGSKEESQKYIQKVTKLFLIQNKHVWKKDIVLLQSRVPILKLVHKSTGLKCDISFISGLGVEKSKLIRDYVTAYRPCRLLILYLKKWFNLSMLYGPRGVTAYAISWYAIFYLQIKGILPSVHQLITLKNQSNLVDGWQCGFLETVPFMNATHTFKNLLQEFFSYYAKFDYQSDVVCPLLGQVIKKRTFASIDNLPNEMEIYKNRMKTEEIEFFRFDSPMCIQDPVDLSQNITKAVTKSQLRCFRYYCSVSSEKLL